MDTLETGNGNSYNFRQEQDMSVNFQREDTFSRSQITMNIDINKPRQQQIQAGCP